MSLRPQEIVVNGMVLSAMDIGEADKRLVILTKQLGKITVFAYGAKRAKSPLVAAANPFVCGEFTITRGKGAYRLQSVKCENYFRELMADFDKSCYGFYFLEFAGYFAMENMDCRDYLNLLYQSFKALLNENIPDSLVRYIFELKMFAINGETPQIYECMVCGRAVENGYFSLEKKGVIHSACSCHKDIHLSNSSIYTLQYIISSSIGKLYSFNVSENVYKEIKKMMDVYRTNMINYTFKSAVFLEK